MSFFVKNKFFFRFYKCCFKFLEVLSFYECFLKVFVNVFLSCKVFKFFSLKV